MKKIAGVSIFVIFFYVIATTQTNSRVNIVTTAVPFLRISPDARAGGMGDVTIVTSPDASAIYYNLAKVPFATSPTSISLTYTPWLKEYVNDVYMINLAAYHKLDEIQSVAAAIRYFNLGSMSFTDFQGNELGKGRPREFSIDVGYSRKLLNKLSLGLTFRYINSNLASGYAINGITYKTGHAIATDISAYYSTIDNENVNGWRFGAALSNLGSKIGYTNNANSKEFIPANLALGASYTHVFQKMHSLCIGVDINELLVPPSPTLTTNPIENNQQLEKYRSQSVISSWFSSLQNNVQQTQIGIGTEYWYNEQFAFRVGYNYANKALAYKRYATIGAGINYNNAQLNISYLIPSGSTLIRNPLSNTLRFSLLFAFKKNN